MAASFVNLRAGSLEGPSALNSEIFTAPSKVEIDVWGKIGNSGWDWESLAPYYRKIHTLHLSDKENREYFVH